MPGNLRTFTTDSPGSDFAQEQRLSGIGSAAGWNDLFSYAMALEGDELAVGAPEARFEDIPTGAVYLYERAPGPVWEAAAGIDWLELRRVLAEIHADLEDDRTHLARLLTLSILGQARLRTPADPDQARLVVESRRLGRH